LAKVVFTTFLYVSPVQISPSCDQTGVPSTSTPRPLGVRLLDQGAEPGEHLAPPVAQSSILASMSSDGDSAFFDWLFVM
jgi:hypothetical protein